jgi:alpha-mannosidase
MTDMREAEEQPGRAPEARASVGAWRRSQVLHMIGNAHIDPVWLWQWPEGYQEVRATFQSAVDRLDEYPDFVFTCDSALFFAWVEESDPALFERIREHVAGGRFQVVGGWWIEPDCNIPCGESFVRQALYGQRHLHEQLGITATVGANLDSFGHNATIPQILAKSGCDSYVFLRPGPTEKELPGPIFHWESPDGSRVLAYRIPHEYCAPKDDIGEHVEKAVASLPEGDEEWAVFYGVGNHGGGPTKANLDQIARMNRDGAEPRLELSSLRAFFDGLAGGAYPTVRGELQHHAPGCYTTHSGIKRWNRRAENLLLRAEKWAAVAESLGLQPYPLAELTQAWKLVLFNQFHDTLAGTSIAPAYEDARDQIGHASSLAASAFNAAAQSIARQIGIEQEEEMRPVVVFNPHPWTLRTDVEIEYTWLRAEGAHVVDDEGEPVPMQMTRPLTTMSSLRGRLVFPVEVPPLGWRVYRVRKGSVESAQRYMHVHAQIENDNLQVALDPATGRIARLVVKATGQDLAAPQEKHAVVVDDRSDTWGHGVRAYDTEVGEFECESVRLLENGPVRSILRVESRYGASRLREDYVLSAGARHVDVRVTLDWHEQLKLLKLRYPTSVETDTATFETPYGHLERPAGGDEEPGQAWVDVSERSKGLTVCNDAKYGYDVRGGDIGISAVRSPVWAWHDPRELEEGGDFEYMDQGRQTFTIRLIPHAGDWREADVVRRSAELNQPPFALIETFHEGPLPQQASYAQDEGPVVLSVLKRGEDGGVVVRAYETAGRAASATLRVLGRELRADFGPHDIKTFHLSDDGVREVSLLEWS